jgi:hypothetical protein
MRLNKLLAASLTVTALVGGVVALGGPAQAATSAAPLRQGNPCKAAAKTFWKHFNKYDIAAKGGSPDGYVSYADLARVKTVGSVPMAKAATYLLGHPNILDKLDTAADPGGSPDGKISRSDAINFISVPPAECR